MALTDTEIDAPFVKKRSFFQDYLEEIYIGWVCENVLHILMFAQIFYVLYRMYR